MWNFLAIHIGKSNSISEHSKSSTYFDLQRSFTPHQEEIISFHFFRWLQTGLQNDPRSFRAFQLFFDPQVVHLSKGVKVLIDLWSKYNGHPHFLKVNRQDSKTFKELTLLKSQQNNIRAEYNKRVLSGLHNKTK